MLLIVFATLALTMVINRAPRKFRTTAIFTAVEGVITLVDTAVAIALGASVQPLTNMTPKRRSTTITNVNDKNSHPFPYPRLIRCEVICPYASLHTICPVHLTVSEH
jgi:hypothetical protein